jgi:nitrite reductase (NADH) small subunit
MSPPGRPKGEYRSAQHEGTPVSENWQPVCRVEDIPVLGARRVARVGSATPIAVFRNAQGQVFALLDQCPHKGGPLSQGIVFGDSVACPLHNWTIGLADGCAKAPDEGCTQRFTCKVEGGQVLLEADALSPAPA